MENKWKALRETKGTQEIKKLRLGGWLDITQVAKLMGLKAASARRILVGCKSVEKRKVSSVEAGKNRTIVLYFLK